MCCATVLHVFLHILRSCLSALSNCYNATITFFQVYFGMLLLGFKKQVLCINVVSELLSFDFHCLKIYNYLLKTMHYNVILKHIVYALCDLSKFFHCLTYEYVVYYR